MYLLKMPMIIFSTAILGSIFPSLRQAQRYPIDQQVELSCHKASLLLPVLERGMRGEL